MQDVMGKLPLFQIINFAHAFFLFQVLSTMKQTGVIWALSVSKVASCHN